MPPNPDVLDGVGQLLLIRDLRPDLELVYHGDWGYYDFVKFINRAKDELVTPDDFDAFVTRSEQSSRTDTAASPMPAQRLATNGNLRPVRDVRSDTRDAPQRARSGRRQGAGTSAEPRKTADREARRTIWGDGGGPAPHQFTPEQPAEIDQLADDLRRGWRRARGHAAGRDRIGLPGVPGGAGAPRRPRLRRADRRDHQLFKRRPNILRRWQRQFRYLLVDEFQDANQDLYHAREPDELGVVMPESPPVYYLSENRRSTRAIHEFAMRFSRTDAAAPEPVALGPEGRRVEIFTYADGDAEGCRRVLGTALRRVIDAGEVSVSDVVVLTPRSNRSSWLMNASGDPVEAWPYRLMPEYGPEGSVLPPPMKGNEVRVATIHRYKGLESAVVVLAEIDSRIEEADLAALIYVGATRARAHLIVIASDTVARQLG